MTTGESMSQYTALEILAQIPFDMARNRITLGLGVLGQPGFHVLLQHLIHHRAFRSPAPINTGRLGGSLFGRIP
ncbi:MAG: hypothetical protein CL388_06910 [Acidiferrobacteraceae bacterium]|nr:hypothetical protein [Acidiferrobacteraceae bacterium]